MFLRYLGCKDLTVRYVDSGDVKITPSECGLGMGYAGSQLDCSSGAADADLGIWCPDIVVL